MAKNVLSNSTPPATGDDLRLGSVALRTLQANYDVMRAMAEMKSQDLQGRIISLAAMGLLGETSALIDALKRSPAVNSLSTKIAVSADDGDDEESYAAMK